MKIKKYNAPTMADAMTQIRSELGNDAVILNSKVIYTGGFLGFFKKKSIEVIAAIDPQTVVEQIPIRKEKHRKVEKVVQKEQMERPISISTQTIKELPEKAIADSQDKVLKELNDLKKIVKSIHVKDQSENLNSDVQEIISILREQEIDREVIDDIMLLLTEKMRIEQLSVKDMRTVTEEYLKTLLPPDATSLFQKKYVNVVGPTGVGKTTTLAKLAAENVLKYQKKIAFITTDTYRIAAIEQLKTYATILNVPIEVAYNLEDFQKACEKFSHYELVFIDTAGRNFRNKEYVEELQNIISFDDEMETYLVLSLTSKQKDMEDIFRQFSLLPISHFIFTKMDETSSFGAMLNMMKNFQISTAYVTNGQNVPDDLVKASSNTIVQSIIGENNHE